MSEYQEEVLTNLLDLQAELRGDEPEPHEGSSSHDDDATAGEEAVTVAEQDVAVTAAPTQLPVNERLAALNERLRQLELELAGVTKRIERIEPGEEAEAPGIADADADVDADVDAPWRSFLDLQRIVADRLEGR